MKKNNMKDNKYTIKDLRAICQATVPDQSITGRSARFFSIFFTRFLIRTNITPNKVTFVGTVIYLIGVLLFAFNIYYLALVGFLILYISTVLDACDGEIFRFRRYRHGYGGSYVEPVSHDIMYGLMFLPIAYGVFLQTGNHVFLILGALAGITKLLFRLAEQRFFYGVTSRLPKRGEKDYTKNFKEQSKLTKFIFVIYRNVCTSTGMLIPLFLTTIFNRLDIFVAFYGVAYSLFWLGLFSRQMMRFRKISKQVIDRYNYFLNIKERAKNKKIIVFDLDGTLLDTMSIFADIASYLIAWKYKISRAKAREMYIQTSGVPFFQQLELIFPSHEHNTEVAKFFEERKVHATDHLEMTSEDKKFLADLISKGYRIAISSNNFQENVDRFAEFSELPFLHILGYRDGFAKGDDHFQHIMAKEDISKEEILFIGDSVSDMKKAIAHNVDFVGKVGTFKREDFEKEFPNAVTVVSLDELNNIL
jgi:phosphoglycolate phosphatase